MVQEQDNLNAEPQVIAAAIATFQRNNRTRAQSGEPELDSMTIPCIVTTGTRPIFYLVPVTRELSEAVITAQYPVSPTLVKRCVVVSKSRRLSEGMESLDFRQVALQHYAAFRTLAEARWSAFAIPGDGSLSCRDTKLPHVSECNVPRTPCPLKVANA